MKSSSSSAAPPLDIEDIHSENLLKEDKKEIPSVFSPMEQELVFLLTGPRGSHKSLGASYIGISEMSQETTVYSNLPIDTHDNFTDLPRLQSLELDIVTLYSRGKDIDYGALYILDEFDKICAARWSSTSNINRVLDWLATQIRKFGTSFILTAQNFFHIDSMWRDQIDIVIFCEDLYHTPWGKKKGLVRGELGFIKCYDKSGFEFGTSNDPYTNPYAEPYAAYYIQGKPLWSTFDTKRLLGIDEMQRRLRFLKEDIYLNSDGVIQSPDTEKATDYRNIPLSERPKAVASQYLQDVINKMILAGRHDTTNIELTHLLNNAGMSIKPDEIGRLIRQAGIQSFGRGIVNDDERGRVQTTKYQLPSEVPA